MMIDRPRQFWLGIGMLIVLSFVGGGFLSAQQTRPKAEAEEPRFKCDKVLERCGYHDNRLYLLTDQKTGEEFIFMERYESKSVELTPLRKGLK